MISVGPTAGSWDGLRKHLNLTSPNATFPNLRHRHHRCHRRHRRHRHHRHHCHQHHHRNQHLNHGAKVSRIHVFQFNQNIPTS